MVVSLPSIIGITPFERPDIQLASALSRNGALGVLDLGHKDADVQRAIAALVRRAAPNHESFGVCVRHESVAQQIDLPANVICVVAPASVVPAIARSHWLADRQLLAQVTTVAEARKMLELEVHGLIAKGSEAGGTVGGETALVLLQRVLKAVTIPVWVQGGIGIHTAAACIAGGAAGIVVDTQLSLLEESATPVALRKAIAAMDGSETKLVHGFRLFHRPGARAASDDSSADEIRQALGASDPANELIAVGQDGAFAAGFAKRYATVERTVLALRRAVGGHIRQAKALQPLAPGSGIARSLGIRYPICQGPMTRVSDRPEFAAAVADSGAFPFLALALLGGEEARQLLAMTRTLLGSRPWGVGILGFVPKELHAHQVQLVLDAKPKAVLIAGGRPSQARPLEAAGIPAFLHVPSPGLLDSFLKDGARRFVFEGQECGGHVGPRTSFMLWESVIERLLAEDSLTGVSVVFAGGIHDAVSAAMVAVMAAPLVARGAQVGVLMGTAYLFTHEAVASGAIGATFQQQALACQETALLQTAPGHATRCVRTPFVDFFEQARCRLEAGGMDAQSRWMELEKLNLGRLRVASKGLRREGDQLVEVGTEEQQREGMFMIGQVAALRDQRCGIADLHAEVSQGATDQIAQLSLPQDPQPRNGADIAIIGAACVFPDAPDLETYWSNIVRGHNSVREVPKERWDIERYYDTEGTGKKSPSKWGAFLDPIVFDPAIYGIPPHSLAAIDPTQLIALHVARAALQDAGLLDKGFDHERAGVVFGAESGCEIAGAHAFRASFGHYIAGQMPAELDACLPTLTEDSFAGVLANVITGRIANRLDLRGPNFTVDAACASSLAAVNSACKELTSGDADLMIAGGADLHNGIADYLMFASAHALSRTGQCRTFDADADGITLGEGVAAIVLKRLADAERDGDRIYAVIKGVGHSSDGKALGLTAPRKEGQMRAVERAYRNAGVSPSEVGLLEAHGTGTVVGDRTELSALTELYGAAGALPRTCTLGSVKSQIGHTKCAAGMAGMLKAMLAIHRGALLPTHNVVKPNPGYADVSPFVLRSTTVPWMSDRRTAAVSAFGFGGTNYHVVLSSHAAPVAEVGYTHWPAELFVLRGADDRAVEATAAAIRASVGGSPLPRLCDLAASVERRNANAAIRCAFVATSLEDVLAKLGTILAGKSAAGVFRRVEAMRGKVAMLFPGQGSQSPGMLAELFVAFPELRGLLEHCQHTEALFPGASFTAEEQLRQQQAITDTRVAQTTLGIVDTAVARLLERCGVRADMFGGHSFGELVALSVAGACDLATLVELSAARAQCILDAAGSEPGTMAAVNASLEQVQAVLAGEADITCANHNAPDQVVIAGTSEAMARALGKLQAASVAAQKLPVACAFHSPLVAGAQHSFGEVLATQRKFPLQSLQASVYANATAAVYPPTPAEICKLLAQQLASPVRFVEQIEAMYDAGARVFVEAGPRSVLTNLVGRILAGKPHVAIAVAAKPKQAIASLLEALAQLASIGVELDLQPLFAGRADVSFELGQSCQPSDTAWWVDGLSARPVGGELPAFAMRPLPNPITIGVTPPLADNAETAVRDFLQSTREIINAQRDVLLSFLGSDPNAARRSAPRLIDSVVSVEPVPLAAVIEKVSPPSKNILELLTQIISERTGYPIETLEVDLELEADLGIDSIKRLEVIGTLRDQLGLAELEADQQTRDQFVEQVAGARTLRTLAKLFESLDQQPGHLTQPAPVSVLDLLTLTVSERTGYPPESLDADLELEADLGIDSIKRLEIIGTLRTHLGLEQIELGQAAQDALLERLAAARTMRTLAALLESVQSEPETSVTSSAALAATDPGSDALDGLATQSLPVSLANPRWPEVERYEVGVMPVLPAERQHARVRGKRFVISGESHSVATALAAKLRQHGAEVSTAMTNAALVAVDGLILLDATGPSSSGLSGMFAKIKSAAQHPVEWIVAVTALGGRFGHYQHRPQLAKDSLGVCGFIKSLAKERPQVRVRAVDLDPNASAAELADQVYAEIVAADSHVEVGYAENIRYVPELKQTPLPELTARAAGASSLCIDSSSVLLLTGGARGITGRIAVEMALRFQCRLELVGRTALSTEPEDDELRAADDMKALRKLILKRGAADGRVTPAQVENRCRQILAEREVATTLAAIRNAGAQVSYHCVDVSGPGFAGLVERLLEQHGRIDGVVHGAGRIEDKLLLEKSAESFARVVATKVASAHTLIDKLAATARFMVFFSSVSSTFGNRGQTDYAAANDALDKLAHWLHANSKSRTLSINWGPWSDVGMVQPELQREYRQRGITLIAPGAGVECFFNELLHGSAPQAVLVAADSAAIHRRADNYADAAEVALA